MQDYEQPRGFWQTLTKQQKWGLGILGFFIILVVMIWSVQLNKTLFEPFNPVLDNDGIYQAGDISRTLGVSDEQARAAYLTSQDTDADGLNDWQEMNDYQTSPYLADSDGDGLTDKSEIDNKTDPNCPQGQTCLNIEPADSQTNSATDITNTFPLLDSQLLSDPNSIDPNALESSVLDPNQATSADQAAMLKQVFGDNPSPDIIRTILMQAGATAEQLSQISDEELLTTYQKMLQGESTSTSN